MNELAAIPFPILTTERLILRKPADEDAHEIFLLRSNEAVNKFLDRPVAHSIEDAIQFIQKINNFISNKQSFYWVITLKDALNVIGTITLFNFSEENTCAEIGYELLPAYQGKGLMQEALKTVIGFAFKNAGFKKLVAFTHIENASSYRLLEKNNFFKDMDAGCEHAPGEEPNMVIYSLVNSDE